MKYLFFYLAFFAFTPLFSQTAAVYTDSKQAIKLGNYMHWLEDPDHSFTISYLQKLADSSFHSSQVSTPNFGASGSKFWLKVAVDNLTAEPLFLLCDEENIFTIDLYVVDEKDSVWFTKTGYYQPYSSREFINNQYTLPLGQNPRTLYIGISGEASLLASFYIGSHQALIAWFHHNDLFEGLFLGWMAVIFIFNLFIFFQLRDTVYLYYCLYVCTSTFVVLRLEGLGFDLIWSDYYFLNRWIDIPPILNSVAVLLFAMHFLQTGAILPRLHRLLRSTIVVLGSFSLLEIFQIRPLSNNLVMISFFFTCGLLWWTGFVAYKKGVRQARFYLLGWSTFIIGVVVMTLWKMGIITTDNSLVYYSFYLAMMTESALFSFALADRIRVYRRETDEARALAMHRLQENEKLLLEHTQLLEKNLQLEQREQPQPQVGDLLRLMQLDRTKVNRLSVPTMEGVLLLPLPDILRLEALGSYCTIYLTNGKKLTASKPLADFESFLSAHHFLRVHKSHLINLQQVTRYIRGDGGSVILSDGSEVGVSRASKTALLEQLSIQ